MMSRLKAKGRRETGQFAGIPKACMKHLNYIELSMPAKVLLWEFCYQYNGFNNGDLCAAFSVLKERGWRSKGTLARAIDELKKKAVGCSFQTGWKESMFTLCTYFSSYR